MTLILLRLYGTTKCLYVWEAGGGYLTVEGDIDVMIIWLLVAQLN